MCQINWRDVQFAQKANNDESMRRWSKGKARDRHLPILLLVASMLSGRRTLFDAVSLSSSSHDSGAAVEEKRRQRICYYMLWQWAQTFFSQNGLFA